MHDYSEILHKGQIHSLGEWEKITNIKYATLRERLRHGWSVEDALTKPAKPRRGPRTHGMSDRREYRIWKSIKERCHGPRSNTRRYARYGGRGIAVCKQWRSSFEAFILDVGRAPSLNHSLGRIKNDGDYTAANCRWETPSEQANNRRTSVIIRYRRKSRTIAEWSRHLGVPYSRFRAQLLRHGGPTGRALKKVIDERRVGWK